VFSSDPNELIGPKPFVLPGELLPYTIHFENMPVATAPAQKVEVTQQVDADLDWTTFELGDISFGDTVVEVPAGRNFFTTRVELPASAPIGGDKLLLDIMAGVNLQTGLITLELHFSRYGDGRSARKCIGRIPAPELASADWRGKRQLRRAVKNQFDHGRNRQRSSADCL
jgi:hypothetical protein